MPNIRSIISVAVLSVALVGLASCANTIKGVGKDAANTVNATQSAGHTVARAARR